MLALSCLAAAACLATFVSATLKVQSNDRLFDRLKSKGGDYEVLKHSLAHFGVVPYGATIMGFVHFDPKNEDGCKKGKLEPFNADDLMPILIVKRGNCEFIDKARNAYMMGAAMLLIADDQEEDVTSIKPVAHHDGSRSKIPTIVIEKADGNAMIDILLDSDKAVSQTVIVQFKMDIPKAERADIQVVLGVADRLGFDFLSSFKDMVADIDSSLLNVTYYFYYDKCEGCSPQRISEDCLDEQANECIFNLDSGKLAVQAIVAHKCALQNQDFQDNYMEFAERYREECLVSKPDSKKLLDCTRRLISAFSQGSSADLDACIEAASKSPKLLRQNSDFLVETRIKEYPAIFINNQSIDGSLSAENVFQAMCFSFESPPQTCTFLNGKYIYSKALNDIISNTRKTEKRFAFFQLFVLLLVFAVAGFIFYYLFKRTYRSHIQNKIDDMIKDSITKYKRMNQTPEEP